MLNYFKPISLLIPHENMRKQRFTDVFIEYRKRA